jgi:hypothetical protein
MERRALALQLADYAKCCGLLTDPRAANAVAADGRPRLDGVIG